MAVDITAYDNFVLSNIIEDQFNSHLALDTFTTHDNSLELTAGMKKTIHKYSATDGTEKLTRGNGNTKTIGAKYTSTDYDIALAQNRFEYYDEDAMNDPIVITTGAQHASVDMFNTINADIFAEFNKATQTLTATTPDFDAFCDAAALLNLENLEDVEKFAFVNAKNMAAIRKSLKTSLQYVEAFAKNGYVGTVAGINLYTKKDAEDGTIILATREAVTLFTKKGTEVETIGSTRRSAEDANVRLNTVFTRKYYVAALTDDTKAVKITIGAGA